MVIDYMFRCMICLEIFVYGALYASKLIFFPPLVSGCQLFQHHLLKRFFLSPSHLCQRSVVPSSKIGYCYLWTLFFFKTALAFLGHLHMGFKIKVSISTKFFWSFDWVGFESIDEFTVWVFNFSAMVCSFHCICFSNVLSDFTKCFVFFNSIVNNVVFKTCSPFRSCPISMWLLIICCKSASASVLFWIKKFHPVFQESLLYLVQEGSLCYVQQKVP